MRWLPLHGVGGTMWRRVGFCVQEYLDGNYMQCEIVAAATQQHGNCEQNEPSSLKHGMSMQTLGLSAPSAQSQMPQAA